MKKSLFLLGVLVLTSFTSVGQTSFKSGDLFYSILKGNTVEVAPSESYKLDGFPTDLVIPSTVTNNGTTYEVTAIGQGALADLTSLVSVTLPTTLKVISRDAFINSLLTKITFQSATLDSLGQGAFWGCSLLESIDVPEGVKYLRDGCFGSCSSLRHVSLPSTLISMENQVFVNCSALTELKMAATVPPAFPEINVPNPDSGLYFNAVFWGVGWDKCIVYVPNDEAVGAYSFAMGWSNFKTIMSPDMGFVFEGILYRVLPDGESVEIASAIDSSPVYDIPEIVSFDGVDYKVVSLGDQAFKSNTNIQGIVLPASLKSIGHDVFVDSSLSSILFSDGMFLDTMGPAVFYNCDGLTSISLPEGLVELPYNIFNTCDNLTSVTLPRTLQYFSTEVFTDCVGLKDLTLMSPVPPSIINDDLTGVFWNVPTKENVIVHIVAGTEEAYAATVWNETNFLQVIGSVVDGIDSSEISAAVNVYADGNGKITIVSDASNPVYVYNVAGGNVYSGTAKANQAVNVNVAKGIYMVKVGNIAKKVMVK